MCDSGYWRLEIGYWVLGVRSKARPRAGSRRAVCLVQIVANPHRVSYARTGLEEPVLGDFSAYLWA